MPRVRVKRRGAHGADRSCDKCGDLIKTGQQYRQWEFRYGGKRYRCMKPECVPRPSDLTQSKIGEVYAAYEGLEDFLGTDFYSEEGVQAAVEACAEEANRVADEYEQAAEPFGGQGENMERAEAVRGFAEELLSLTVPELPEEVDEDAWRLAFEKQYVFNMISTLARTELRSAARISALVRAEDLPDNSLDRADYCAHHGYNPAEHLDELQEAVDKAWDIHSREITDALDVWREDVREEILGIEMGF